MVTILHTGARKVEVSVKDGKHKGRPCKVVRPIRDAGASDGRGFKAITAQIRDNWLTRGYSKMTQEVFEELSEVVE